MAPVGFKFTIAVGERPWAYDFDRAAAGIGNPYDLAGGKSAVATQDNHSTIKESTLQHYTVRYSQPIGMLHRTAYPASHRTSHYHTTQDNHNTIQGNTTQHYTMESFDPRVDSPVEYQDYFLGGGGGGKGGR
jgi:hypothetical protein